MKKLNKRNITIRERCEVMEERTTMSEIFMTIRKNIIWIIISTFIGMAVAGGLTFFVITPKYSSSAELIIQSKNNDAESGVKPDVTTNVLMINTYKDMIKGKTILQKVKNELTNNSKLNLSIEKLTQMINVVQSANSQMFRIEVTAEDPYESAIITNTIALVFQETAVDFLDINKVSITSEAEPVTTPVSPNHKLNLLIGLVIGFLIGLDGCFLSTLFDKTVKNEKYITDVLGLPIIGELIKLNKQEIKKGKSVNLTTVFEETGENRNISRSSRKKL